MSKIARIVTVGAHAVFGLALAAAFGASHAADEADYPHGISPAATGSSFVSSSSGGAGAGDDADYPHAVAAARTAQPAQPAQPVHAASASSFGARLGDAADYPHAGTTVDVFPEDVAPRMT